MTLHDLRHIENLARIVGQFDEEPPLNGPARWGPASWWRIGLVVLAVMIAVLAVWRSVG